MCDPEIKDAHTIGLFAVDSVDDLSAAEKIVKSWAGGDCPALNEAGAAGTLDMEVLVSKTQNYTNGVLNRSSFADLLSPRADCKAIQVVSGDGCGSLATRCGISGADLSKYNPQKNFCATLKPKQWVCCSAGTLPDMTPKPQPDGTCAVHEIAAGDDCWGIADHYGITVDRINAVNNATWGWAGCSYLQIGQRICLSTGSSPTPSAVNGAVCGPQVPGTKAPTGPFTGFDMADLNPCPLNACCSGWGFCGITAEFCTESPADTKAPGTVKPGTNGCISHCGTEIVGNDNPPAEFRRVGYFEAFNVNRSCLTMDVTDISSVLDPLTHVHLAFAGLTANLGITFDKDVQEQFNRFVQMDASFKKIISFGGWAESTDADTFQRHKDIVKPANREAFADTVVKFVTNNNLDGVDFDWEYPGATDIPGVPNGGDSETSDYLEFFKLMADKLKGKSLSIALPASYWYLRPFPVDKMAKYLSYFIFMTYDLHGQWDYGNQYANPGCKNGNCLRSHVNKTETHDALAMITKAGVPASKIMVGIASYGRSFGMQDASCTGPMCTFTGSFTESTAEPGACTNTAGYISNAELADIIASADEGASGYEVKQWHDDVSDSDLMVYGTHWNATTWVAYMDDDTKNHRVDWIRQLNFGGTSDWALDLQTWYTDGDDDSGASDLDTPSLECDSSLWPSTLDELNTKIDTIPPDCRGLAVFSILMVQLEDAITHYNEASEGYDDKFGYYVDWVKDSIDSSLESFMGQNGTKYMDCEWESRVQSGSGPCTEISLGLGDIPPNAWGPRSITYKMRDENGFYDALSAEYGIDKAWIEWKDTYGVVDPCICPTPGNCPQCTGTNAMIYHNYPRRISDTSKIDVPNPKKIVDESIPQTDDLADVLLQTFIEMRLGVLDADDQDVLTAISMPVFMLEGAATSIEEIKEIGAEEKKAKTTELVLNILTIVFAVIPFVGEAAGALGAASVFARAALIIGEAGNAAISIKEIIDNPASAPFAIAGMLVGAGGLAAKGSRKAFSEAAGARRALTADKLKLFGAEFQRKDGLVQSILSKCGV